MRTERHKKARKQEVKASATYEGWDADMKGADRNTPVGNTMLAGMEDSGMFHEKRDTCIQKKYDADEIEQRVLNSDDRNWVRESYDLEAIFQLDHFHICQEVLRKIRDK